MAADPPRRCVILVGGLGTRLGELTQRTPKPLLPVDGRPFLELLLIEAARCTSFARWPTSASC